MNADEDRIRQLEDNVARLEKELRTLAATQAAIQKELLRLGPRQTLLTGAAHDRLVSVLRRFPGQSAELRFGLNPIGFLQNIPAPASDDVIGVLDALAKILGDAQWTLPPGPFISPLQSPPGITVQISPNASGQTVKAADILVKALREALLETQGPTRTETKANPRMGEARHFTGDVPGGSMATRKPAPPQTEETIVISVLARPM